MTIFIEADLRDGARININEIVYLWDELGENKTVIPMAELRDGKKVRLQFLLRADLVARAGCPVLPAQPGFELLAVNFDSTVYDGPPYRRQPVIGWRIELHGAMPIVFDDDVEKADALNRAIKYPDGQVFSFYDALTYLDEAQWRAALKEHIEMEREAALKVATP